MFIAVFSCFSEPLSKSCPAIPMTIMFILYCVSSTEILLILPHLFLFLKWENFYWYVFKFPGSFSVFYNPFTENFTTVAVLLSVTVSICIFLEFVLLCWYLLSHSVLLVSHMCFFLFEQIFDEFFEHIY